MAVEGPTHLEGGERVNKMAVPTGFPEEPKSANQKQKNKNQ